MALIEDELRQDFPNEQVCFSFYQHRFFSNLKQIDLDYCFSNSNAIHEYSNDCRNSLRNKSV